MKPEAKRRAPSRRISRDIFAAANRRSSQRGNDMKFLDGFPGQTCRARAKGEGRWYVTGINAENTAKNPSLDLSEMSVRSRGALITDDGGGNLSFRQTRFGWIPARN